MKVSEKWHIHGRSGDFVLTERSVRKDAKGVERVSEKSTYHPNVEQCLNKVVRAETLEQLGDDATTVTGLKDFLTQLKQDIKEIAHAAQAAVPADREPAGSTDQEG